MKSKELLALKNLAGFRLALCYWVELEHGLMGTFPALISKTKDVFACTEEETFKQILKLLPNGGSK